MGDKLISLDSDTLKDSDTLANVAKNSCIDNIYSEDESSIEQPIWEDESAPPSYQSLFGHFKDARDSSENAISFFKRAIETFVATIGCTATLLLLLALPVSMVIIGAEFRNECPVEPFIPIYLVVGGTFGMLKTVTALCQRAVKTDTDVGNTENEVYEQQSMAAKFLDGVLNLFLFIWFIAGNIWVYSKYKPNFTPPKHSPFNYCHPTLYLFAFWVITSSYILMALICFCVCCLGLCASCTAFFVANTAT